MRGLHLAVALVLAVLTGVAHGQDEARDACPSDLQLDYLCGAEKPEDILILPGTDWLISSGFSPGAGLKLIDRPKRQLTRWYSGAPEQMAWDRRAHAACPGPLNPSLFNARGLSLRRTGPDRWRLLVVNHGGRESIEVFDVLVGAGAPRLRWRGCLPMPAGEVGNSVASFSDGTILVTVLTRPGTTIADFVAGRNTGRVWQYTPETRRFAIVPGTDLPGNNGLETDPDDRHFYVVAFGWHAVLIYDRRDPGAAPVRVDASDFMPDNIHWSGSRLLLAGMRLDEPACGGLRKIANGVADPMLCHRGWIVGELDPAKRRIATVAYGTPQPGFNGLSAAAIAGPELWLGSFQASRIAIMRAPLPLR